MLCFGQRVPKSGSRYGCQFCPKNVIQKSAWVGWPVRAAYARPRVGCKTQFARPWDIVFIFALVVLSVCSSI